MAENGLLQGNVDSLRNEIRALQDLCAHCVEKSGDFEFQLQDTPWTTVLKCTEFLNRQSNLSVMNVPKVFQLSTTPRMQTLKKTHLAVFQTQGSPNTFASIKRHKCLGGFTAHDHGLWW